MALMQQKLHLLLLITVVAKHQITGFQLFPWCEMFVNQSLALLLNSRNTPGRF